MLIVVEPDTKLRKKMCDILSRERMICVDSVAGVLEKVCYFRAEVNAIISRVDFLFEIHNRQMIRKVCNKMHINEPPIVGYYLKSEESMKKDLENMGAKYKIIPCDENDAEFPVKYIDLVKDVYPELTYDLDKAKKIWSRTPEQEAGEQFDARKWLKEQGLSELLDS